VIDHPGGVIVRTTEEVNDCCRAANDRTRTVIVRSYRTGPVELNVKLEKKNQIYEN
jgi:FAD/FMN-containing dehydrogenase